MGVRGGAAALVGLLLTGCGGGPLAEGGCAGPMVSVSPASAAPGDEVRVRSGNLWSDCYDTGQPGTPPPSRDVAIQFRPAGSTVSVELATVDADAQGQVDVPVRIPADTPTGPADVVIWGASATVEVTGP